MTTLIKVVIGLILAPFSWFGIWLFGVGIFLVFCWFIGVVFT